MASIISDISSSIRKLRNQKICQFEPTLKSSLFSGSNFSTFFSSICPKSTKVKNRPYLTVIRAQKYKENSISYLSYMLPKFNTCFATPGIYLDIYCGSVEHCPDLGCWQLRIATLIRTLAGDEMGHSSLRGISLSHLHYIGIGYGYVFKQTCHS